MTDHGRRTLFIVLSLSSFILTYSHTHHIYTYICTHTEDRVIITEQTLDQLWFIVINQRTGERGRVPIDYIRMGKSNSSIEPSLSTKYKCLQFRVPCSGEKHISWE